MPATGCTTSSSRSSVVGRRRRRLRRRGARRGACGHGTGGRAGPDGHPRRRRRRFWLLSRLLFAVAARGCCWLSRFCSLSRLLLAAVLLIAVVLRFCRIALLVGVASPAGSLPVLVLVRRACSRLLGGGCPALRLLAAVGAGMRPASRRGGAALAAPRLVAALAVGASRDRLSRLLGASLLGGRPRLASLAPVGLGGAGLSLVGATAGTVGRRLVLTDRGDQVALAHTGRALDADLVGQCAQLGQHHAWISEPPERLQQAPGSVRVTAGAVVCRRCRQP